MTHFFPLRNQQRHQSVAKTPAISVATSVLIKSATQKQDAAVVQAKRAETLVQYNPQAESTSPPSGFKAATGHVSNKRQQDFGP